MDQAPDPLLDLLRSRLPADAELQLPPPCLLDMQAELVEWREGESLTMRFPVLPRYRNPLGFMQGGFIAAALDNTLGPFSYLIAPPSVTSQLNLSYLRPVPPGTGFLTCTAWLVARSGKNVHLRGEAVGDDGRIAALAQAACQLI